MSHASVRSAFTVAAALAVSFASPSLIDAHQPPFTDSFMQENCTFTNTETNPYFILEPGYQLVLEGMDKQQFVHLTVTVLNDTELVDGVQTRVVEERELHDGALAEVSRNYYAICEQTDSVFYFGEDTDTCENGVVVSHEGSWRAGVNDARAGIFMPGTVLTGSRYFEEVAPTVAMDAAENISLDAVVTTPLGTFDHALEVEETTPLEPNEKEYKFYAAGIGALQDETLKLVSYGFGS